MKIKGSFKMRGPEWSRKVADFRKNVSIEREKNRQSLRCLNLRGNSI